MKITAQEEYGLRILIRIANSKDAGITIPQLSEDEGITSHYVAKLTRVLRMKGFINSTPGNKGGYVLAKPAKEIAIKSVLDALGGVNAAPAIIVFSHGIQYKRQQAKQRALDENASSELLPVQTHSVADVQPLSTTEHSLARVEIRFMF